jgi:hypothetical protein
MAFKMKGSPMARNYGAPFEHGTSGQGKAGGKSTVYAGHAAGEHDESNHKHTAVGTAYDNPGDAPVAKNPDGSNAKNPERSPEYLAEKEALDKASKAKVKASKKPSTDAVADPSRSPYKNHKEGHQKQTPEQIARLAKINKALGGNSGISEKAYQKLKAEQKALSGE